MKQLILTLFVISCLISCKPSDTSIDAQKNNDVFLKFSEHIAYATDGVISTRDPITIALTQPVEQWRVNKELDQSLVQLSPSVSGKVMSLDEYRVSFIPEQPLDHNTLYEVRFNLGAVKEVDSEFNKLIYEVKTIEQDFIIHTQPMASYDSDYLYLSGTIESSDLMDKTQAASLVKASINGKSLPIKYPNANSLSSHFTFKIDSIQRPVDDTELEISWNGSPIDVDKKASNSIKIPGKNSFAVIDVNLHNDDGQYLQINFSDPLSTSQNLNGLVQIEGVDDYRYDVKGNRLFIYPNQPVTGSKKVDVFTSIKSENGYTLKKEYNSYIAFEQVPPSLELLSNGTILPSSNRLKINFRAVNLNAVDVWVYKVYTSNVLQYLQANELNSSSNIRRVARPVARQVINLKERVKDVTRWHTYAVDLNNIITPDPGAVYRVELKYKYAYSAYVCDTQDESTSTKPNINYDVTIDSKKWDQHRDYYYDDYNYYDYDWEEQDNPCNNSYYRNKSQSTNILATDLGITLKKGENNSYMVAVNDIVSSQPKSGVKIQLYNYQQQNIYTGHTNSNGILHIDLRDQVAYMVKASHNKQFAYLRLDDGNALSISKYDTSGKKLNKGIKGYLYTDRGVWRPGDDIYLSFILNDTDNNIPNNHPVKLELRDPNGKMVYHKVVTSGLNNVYPFTITTDQDAPTGNWNARVEVGGAHFSKTLKIETIKPNRLKIKLSFDDEILKSRTPSNVQIHTQWLHGATAKGLKAQTTAKLYSIPTRFKKYDQYIFDDPSRNYNTEEKEVFNGTVDQQGNANFRFNPGIASQAPGMLKASFLTKVYENGGDFSTHVTTKNYSPYPSYVGLKVPETHDHYGTFESGKKHQFQVVSLDEEGKTLPNKKLEVKLYKIQWRWWWQSNAGRLSRYESEQHKQEVYHTSIQTNSKGEANFNIQIDENDWGRYLVRVQNPTSGHAAGKVIYMDQLYGRRKNRPVNPENASMLIFNSDKENYQVGETAQISFPSAAGGNALVTVENGTQVLDAQWVSTTANQTRVNLPLNNLYVPNVFVHISYTQPHAQTLNDLPLRTYGVIPLLVENEKTHLYPEIKMPSELAPASTANITVSEKNNQPMTYTLAVVDEGLLDLTNFKTPNPWNSFYAREALGVKTWDIYDDVIGAYGGRIEAAFAIGGDENAQGAKAKKANRFKPMHIHLGPFSLPAGASKTHKINIPQYVGSVRVMVVAAHHPKESYGSIDTTAPVKKPLMMLPSLPRKLSPGEQLKLPVTVFAMDQKIKDVKVHLDSSPYFEITGNSTQSLSFFEPGDQIAYFDVKVKEASGIATVQLTATGHGESASSTTPIDVINPNPFSTVSEKTHLKVGSNTSIDLVPFGSKGTNSASVTFSSLPPMDFDSRLNFLIRYPHGCVEQTTSAAFPQLYLHKVVDLTTQKEQKITKNIKAAIKKLGSFQRPNGGLSYWPGSRNVNEWGTNYAGHFLIEAEKMGYTIPVSFKSNWIRYQKRAAKQWRRNSWNDLTQAYRLYTLALVGAADLSSMNRLRETKNLSNTARLRLAASYALVGQDHAANELLQQSHIDFKTSTYDYRTYGSIERNRAMALESMTLLKQKDKARALLEDIARSMNKQTRYSTQTTAYSLLAVAQYVNFIGGTGVDVAYTHNDLNDQISTPKSLVTRDLIIDNTKSRLNITNQGDNDIYISMATTGKLPVGKEKLIQSKLKANIYYTDKDGKDIKVNTLSQGTQIIAHINLTNDTSIDINDVALTQILPSGWELVNTRFTDYGDNTKNTADYTDIRDDRINYYFDLKARQIKKFTTVLNASYLGQYYLPGIQAEAMYDHEYLVRNKGQWIEVIK